MHLPVTSRPVIVLASGAFSVTPKANKGHRETINFRNWALLKASRNLNGYIATSFKQKLAKPYFIGKCIITSPT